MYKSKNNSPHQNNGYRSPRMDPQEEYQHSTTPTNRAFNYFEDDDNYDEQQQYDDGSYEQQQQQLTPVYSPHVEEEPPSLSPYNNNNNAPPREDNGLGYPLEDNNNEQSSAMAGEDAALDMEELEQLQEEAERMKGLGNKHMAAQVSFCN